MIDLQFYRSLLMRRLPVMLALLITCSAFGLVWAVKAPPIYSTAARLLVEEPQIAESDNSPSPSESLDVIEQQLMTRANLIDIANKLNVFRGDATLSVDDKVARMRAGTSIRRIAGRDQATMMTVGFTSTDPRIAAAVVNEFTTLVLSTNTRNRVGLAENRLAFYQQEVQRLGDDLDQQNAKILEFKQKNADALPENLRYSQDRQSLLQERVSRLESDLSTLQAQKQDMVRLFEQTGSIRQNDTPQTPEQQQLSSLQAELNNTLGVYAEGSPKVQALRARIAAAQKAIEAASPADEAGQTGNSLLDINLAQLDTRIETIGLTGGTVDGGWPQELDPEDNLHTLLEVHTDEGASGLGSCFTSKALVEASLKILAPLLVGRPANEPERSTEVLRQQTFWQGRGGAIEHTISGLDIALWDLMGKVCGQSVSRLLGGRYRERIRPYGSILFDEPGRLAEHLASVVERGFKAVKLGWRPTRFASSVARNRMLKAITASIGAWGTLT